jgi:hypothetical protein
MQGIISAEMLELTTLSQIQIPAGFVLINNLAYSAEKEEA